ncbi:MAG: type II toxin-antitoxin system VapB family antitoxin [Propioniciclava sp.]
MGLNIKNERVHALAKQAAAATGQSQTGAIEEALTRMLRELGQDPNQVRVEERIDLARSIVARYQGMRVYGDHPMQRVEDLYDEMTGLPR